jgi:hypothetical protein
MPPEHQPLQYLPQKLNSANGCSWKVQRRAINPGKNFILTTSVRIFIIFQIYFPYCLLVIQVKNRNFRPGNQNRQLRGTGTWIGTGRRVYLFQLIKTYA